MVYGRRQRLSCREIWGQKLEVVWAFFQSRPEVISISYRDVSVPGGPSEAVCGSCGLL